jgi:hypothetical protein
MLELEKGNKELKFEIIDKEKSVVKNNSIDETSLSDTISKLKEMTSREDGLELLNNKYSLRQDYEAIAKQIDIPHTKKDSIDKLKEKIIEGTIGFRLRSQAIQDKTE